jgi:hypothetical protein
MSHKPWLAGFGSFALLGAVFFQRDSTPAGAQPIAFNHAKHISSGMSCTDCHTGAESQANATVPALAFCLTCHENPLTESAEEKKIGAFAKAGIEPPWQPLPRVPPHVYFSHRRHVQLAGLECAACHGPMDKATAPPRALFRPLNMDDCLRCHNERRARTDCNDCHR